MRANRNVKGHSTDGGNSRADELVQWGKGDGPFSQLRHDGEIEGEGALRAEPDYEERMARRKAAKRNRGGDSLANQNADEESPTTAAARGRLEGMGSGRRDAANADRFSTVGLRAAVDALENEPDIS